MKVNITEHFCTKLATCEHIEALRSRRWETEYAFNKALYDRCMRCGDYTPAGDTNEKEI